MSIDENDGDLTPARPRIDLSDFGYDAERRAELEHAGYQITQKRDGGWWWSDRDADDGPFEGNDEALPDESAAINQAWQHLTRVRAETPRGFVVPGRAELENAMRAGVGQAVVNGALLDELCGLHGHDWQQVFRGFVKLKPGETYTPGLLDPSVPEGYRYETDDDLRARLLRGEDRREVASTGGNLSITVDGPGLGETPLVDPADLEGKTIQIAPTRAPIEAFRLFFGDVLAAEIKRDRKGFVFDTRPTHDLINQLDGGEALALVSSLFEIVSMRVEIGSLDERSRAALVAYHAARQPSADDLVALGASLTRRGLKTEPGSVMGDLLRVVAEMIVHGRTRPGDSERLNRARLACLARTLGLTYTQAAALSVADLDARARQAVEQQASYEHLHGIVDQPDGEGGAALVDRQTAERITDAARERFDALTGLVDEMAASLSAAREHIANGDDIRAVECLEASGHNLELDAMQLKRQIAAPERP